ncbi:MAG TPA: hypothetical protein VFO60_06290, partial [Candidatus Dormibacteraeota bacterium]|nr:hypothetical protein [Candidatus Dormibacteraeota bacterium]
LAAPAPDVAGDGVEVFGSTGADPAAALAAHLDGATSGVDYVAFMAYVNPNDADEAALQGLRVAARDSRRVATTLGFGPRFLHSTGQLHKGGPDTGVYVQITVDDAVDAAIPGRPFTFSTLKRAQADGDLESLRSHGRRVVRLHVSDAAALPAALGELARGIGTAGPEREPVGAGDAGRR